MMFVPRKYMKSKFTAKAYSNPAVARTVVVGGKAHILGGEVLE